MKPITVLLADDNRLVRKTFRKILEVEDDLEVVGEAKDGKQAVALVKKFRPAMVLMDLSMPVLNGLEATAQILAAFPATKILMLSSYSDEVYMEAAANSGALGYLLKHSAGTSVCAALRQVQQGRTVFSPSVSKRFRQRNWEPARD